MCRRRIERGERPDTLKFRRLSPSGRRCAHSDFDTEDARQLFGGRKSIKMSEITLRLNIVFDTLRRCSNPL